MQQINSDKELREKLLNLTAMSDYKSIVIAVLLFAIGAFIVHHCNEIDHETPEIYDATEFIPQ